MARISNYIGLDESVPRDFPWIQESFTCSFCGEDARKGSVWFGHDIVVICDVCLRNGHVLGALLGDGVLDVINKRRPNESRRLMERILSETECGMYRAIAHSAFTEDPDATGAERMQKSKEKRERDIREFEAQTEDAAEPTEIRSVG